MRATNHNSGPCRRRKESLIKSAQVFHSPFSRDSSRRLLQRSADSAVRVGQGFTLVEVLLALAICAIVLVAIQAVFATAVKLRERTSAAVAEGQPAERAFETLRRDLKSAVGPGGVLEGDFKCGVQTVGSNMGITGDAAGSGLDFFTTSGTISDSAPWGDVQEVFYTLRASTDPQQQGMELVRYVNRNLLSTVLVTPDSQTVLAHISTMEFDCYDGMEWRNYWDTSSGDTNLPAAIRIRIQMEPQNGTATASAQPLEMTVPFMTITRTNFTAAQ